MASNANASEGSLGFASLPAGFIARGDVGRCAFMVNMQVGLGPSEYKFVIGAGDTFAVTASQAAIANFGSHGLVEGVDVNIVAKPE
ncbi:MAG TPA: hypothetical protein VG125_28525 [Pirellulales bacterium]|nr:hypothetical protein [Pirellulales bacterium]